MNSPQKRSQNNIAPPVESPDLQEQQDEFDAAIADVPVSKRVAMVEALMNLPESPRGLLEDEQA